MISKAQGGRNQEDFASFIDHSKEFEVFIRAKLLKQECDIINLPSKKIILISVYRLHWKGAIAEAERQVRKLLQEIKMVVRTEIICIQEIA